MFVWLQVFTALLLFWGATGAEEADPPPNVCQLPPEGGPCDGAIPQYYYDAKSKQCKIFIYGGCGGNGNRFETEAECYYACHCKLPMDVGPCDGSVPRYYYDMEDNQCKKFEWGGCGGNKNNFQTKSDCDRTCRCKLPSDRGPCKGWLTRYFYNSEKKICEHFIYGGCGGNGNNFEKASGCIDTCRCFLPKDPGPCEAHIPRFYYDYSTNQCLQFFYGGCGGNDNRFATKEECLHLCSRNVIHDDTA